MKLLIFLPFFILVAGCVGVGTRQTECEQKYSSFPEVVNCTKQSFANTTKANNPMVKLYFLKGDQLVEELNKGEISELDARTEWQSLYVQLRSQEKAEKARFTSCDTSGGNLNCTTY